MKKLSMNIARGALQIIATVMSSQALSAIGITDADIRLVKGGAPWTIADRARVCRVLDQALYSSMELCGLPKFSASAEYQAATIKALVHPTNTMVACHWVSENRAAEDITGEAGVDAMPVKPEALHCHVCALYGDSTSLDPQFDKNNNAEIEKKKKPQKEAAAGMG